MWSYQLDTIIPTCRDFEDKLIKLVWNLRSGNSSISSVMIPSSTVSSETHFNERNGRGTFPKTRSSLCARLQRLGHRDVTLYVVFLATS